MSNLPRLPHAPRLPRCALLLALRAGSAAYAQDSDPVPTEEPDSPARQRIEVLKDSMPRMGTNSTPIEPTEAQVSTPHQTGLTSGQDWMNVVNDSVAQVELPSALAEGSFILSRTGRLVPAPNDRLIFVPDPAQRVPGEGPVLLLPCSTLDQLESIWANQTVTVSGEVLTYHGRNHLLISDFAVGIVPTPSELAAEESAASSAPTEASESTDSLDADADPMEESDEPSGLSEDPDVLELLRELDVEDNIEIEQQRILPANARLQSQSNAQLQTAAPSLAPGIREGSLLIRRPGRLDRAPDGSWIAVFDHDEATSSDAVELTVLPCSLLMSMENQAIAHGDSTRFVVSGRIYIHNDRGYLLPTFYQRLRTSDIKPWQ